PCAYRRRHVRRRDPRHARRRKRRARARQPGVRQLQQPFTIRGQELRAAVRAGLALFPADGADADALFQKAEAARRKAKDTGEHYLFYAPDMNARAAHALSLENRLRKAVERQQFVLHYQPRIDLASDTVCGLEALIRWNDPDAGLVPPIQFIPLLEET